MARLLGAREFRQEGFAISVGLSHPTGLLPREQAEPVATFSTVRSKERLRGIQIAEPFHVILVEPEIPPNTGNIARLCAATSTKLHLVGKLGFSIDEHAVRRAGLDYWHWVTVAQHAHLEAAEKAASSSPDSKSWLFSAHAERSYLEADYSVGDRFVFGKESVGLPESLLEDRADCVVGIPTENVRSLNLANCVSIALYEALRQTGALHRKRSD